eukprot:c5299_g1_i1.p1 GENE.c5299_g1_i1~~c5299_g1_i1.p1  ORF type:complete len:884 (-),score=162.64 c5299_g1_i1:47-2506(-)
MERRIVAQMLTCMDALTQEHLGVGKAVIVLGATNRPDSLDEALRRAGRFDREICLCAPGTDSRQRILQVLCSKLRTSGDVDFVALAKRTAGFVGADLQAVTNEAAALAIRRIFALIRENSNKNIPPIPIPDTFVTNGAATQQLLATDATEDRDWSHVPLTPEQLSTLAITWADFEAAVGRVQPSATREGFATIPSVTWADIGALDELKEELELAVVEPIRQPELFESMGLKPSVGVLMYGPPGCGKTLLANAIAGELGIPYFKVSAPELVSGMSGESEERIRDLFDAAKRAAPSLIFIDEVDAIAPKRENAQREMERRIVAQMLTCMDALTQEHLGVGKAVIVLGATNRPDSLDEALRRAGRFDREICLCAPGTDSRQRILQVLCSKLRTSGDVDFVALAKRTAGFVGADLQAVTNEAAALAIRRIFALIRENSNKNIPPIPIPDTFVTNGAATQQLLATDATEDRDWSHVPLTPEQLSTLAITWADFEAAVGRVQPSATREGFATIPSVTWADIGALDELKEELELAVVEPIRQPELFESMGLKPSVGVLMYGPPGCGKTLLAQAVANASGANFISVKGPELLDKFVGESERAVRRVFQRGRASAPCVIFFDELDSLTPRRGSDGGGASERVVNQLLTEMDGLGGRGSVFIIAATNRPDIIDPAMLRPGRLDKLLYVPLPSQSDRFSILTKASRAIHLSQDVDLAKIAADPRCEGFSGADITGLVREAAVSALRDTITAKRSNLPAPPIVQVHFHHFERAFEHVFASVSRKDQQVYSRLQTTLRQARTRLPRSNETPGESTNESSDGNLGGAPHTAPK